MECIECSYIYQSFEAFSNEISPTGLTECVCVVLVLARIFQFTQFIEPSAIFLIPCCVCVFACYSAYEGIRERKTLKRDSNTKSKKKQERPREGATKSDTEYEICMHNMSRRRQKIHRIYR